MIGWALDKTALLLVRGYSLLISPLLAPSCRFMPTCSAYMIEAIRRYGALKGIFLGFLRLGRCHPWHRACGFDPVPERFDWADLIRYKRGRAPGGE